MFGPGVLLVAVSVAAGAEGSPGWPRWRGPFGNGSGVECGRALVDDLGKATEVWTCDLPELPSPSYGGYSDLAVGDGRVYVYYFRPGGDLVDARILETARARGWAGGSPAAQRTMALLRADDVVLCLDAATGRLLWRRVYRAKGMNQNCFSGGGRGTWGPQCTPCVADGKLYALSSMGRLYCMDAGTGRPIWESDLGPQKRLVGRNVARGNPLFQEFAPNGHREQFVSCPVIADGVLVCNNGDDGLPGAAAPGLSGFDARTGRPLWDVPGVLWLYSSPVLWAHRGKEYVICGGGGAACCVEPRTGRVLWTVGGKRLGRGGTMAPAVTDDLMVCDSVCYRITPEKAVVQCRLAQSAGMWPAIYKGRVFTTHGGAGVTCMDLDSGQIVAKSGSIAGNSYWHVPIAGDGRVFHSSGRKAMPMYDACGEGMRQLPGRLGIAAWIPPVYVAGRMYLRCDQAVRCYDLRRDGATPASGVQIEPAVDSPYLEARRQAAAAAATTAHVRLEEALRTVREWLASEDWHRLEAAASATTGMGADGERAFGALEGACLRLVAKGRWAEAGELLDMVPELRQGLAARLTPKLEPLLGSTDAGTVVSACGFAAVLGAPARVHARRLLALYRQADAAGAWAAARALDAAGVPDGAAQEAVAATVPFLASGVYHQQWGALMILERLGPRASPAVTEVAALAGTRRGCLQVMAWDVLIAVGRPAAPALAELLLAVRRSDSRILDRLNEMRKEDLESVVARVERLTRENESLRRQAGPLLEALRKKCVVFAPGHGKKGRVPHDEREGERL